MVRDGLYACGCGHRPCSHHFPSSAPLVLSTFLQSTTAGALLFLISSRIKQGTQLIMNPSDNDYWVLDPKRIYSEALNDPTRAPN